MVICTNIKLGEFYTQREQIVQSLEASTTNFNVITKAAVMKFFEAIPWLKKL